MEYGFSAEICELQSADGAFSGPDKPVVEASPALLQKLAGKVVLEMQQFLILLSDVVAQHVDCYFEIYEVHLSLHFPIYAEEQYRILPITPPILPFLNNHPSTLKKHNK